MQLLRALVVVALLLKVSCGTTHGMDYFLAPDGDDAAAGTREAPWQSIARANQALEAGDTAIFLPGDYTGAISPVNSGTAEAPIVYRSAEPRAARLIPEESWGAILLNGHEYIVIENFFVDGEDRANWGTVANCRQITISGCEMRATSGGSFYNFMVRDSSHLRIIDNIFDRATPHPVDQITIRQCSHVLFEGNSTARAGHKTFSIDYSNYVVARANVLHNEWGRNHSVWNSGRILFEGNIMTRARDSAGSAGSVSQTSHNDSIIRYNRIFDNLGAAWATATYLPRHSRTGLHRAPFVNSNNRWYHNVFSDNLGYREGYVLTTGDRLDAKNVFQNNIFHRNDWAGGHVHVHLPESRLWNRWISNLFYGDEPGQARLRYADELLTPEEANSSPPQLWSMFQENLDADPGFVDAQNRDYRLTPESEAIDAGAPLTWTIGAGSGRVLPVNDGVPFYDGFGIEGEQGDWIAVGSGDNVAQIERVGLRYSLPALLHLDREMTWEDGAPVSLPWAGEAPDIGIYEHGLEHHPTRVIPLADRAIIEPGETVQFGLDTLGKQVETVAWDFGDGTLSYEPEPAHTFEDSGQYGITVRATFPNGGRSVEALFIRVEEPVDPSAPFVEADFEDETRLTHWGYHFKFYRGHQTGYARVERPDGEGKCMHLFYDANKRNRSTADLAPGAWEIDRYPILRFNYRIPEGVPLALEVTTFQASERPDGFTLGGTDARSTRYEDLDAYRLIDDGQWHAIEIDVRRVREIHPDLQHLRQFIFYTNWQQDEGQEFWFDSFYIMPE